MPRESIDQIRRSGLGHPTDRPTARNVAETSAAIVGITQPLKHAAGDRASGYADRPRARVSDRSGTRMRESTRGGVARRY